MCVTLEKHSASSAVPSCGMDVPALLVDPSPKPVGLAWPLGLAVGRVNRVFVAALAQVSLVAWDPRYMCPIYSASNVFFDHAQRLPLFSCSVLLLPPFLVLFSFRRKARRCCRRLPKLAHGTTLHGAAREGSSPRAAAQGRELCGQREGNPV